MKKLALVITIITTLVVGAFSQVVDKRIVLDSDNKFEYVVFEDGYRDATMSQLYEALLEESLDEFKECFEGYEYDLEVVEYISKDSKWYTRVRYEEDWSLDDTRWFNEHFITLRGLLTIVTAVGDANGIRYAIKAFIWIREDGTVEPRFFLAEVK